MNNFGSIKSKFVNFSCLNDIQAYVRFFLDSGEVQYLLNFSKTSAEELFLPSVQVSCSSRGCLNPLITRGVNHENRSCDGKEAVSSGHALVEWSTVRFEKHAITTLRTTNG